MSWPPTAAETAWLAEEAERLLGFAEGARNPGGGFGWLADDGTLTARPRELWITARMTHCFALARLQGRPGAADLVAHGVRDLAGPFHDDEHGGWFAAVDGTGPVATGKEAYGHAFVVLAASSAVLAGDPGAAALLAEALATFQERFWQDGHGMAADRWDRTFTELDPYRGINANMHTVEAFLAAADATGDPLWRLRALRVAERVAGLASRWDWRLPEHFAPDWTPLPDFSADSPADPFRPYGATVGHGLEWARLLLSIEAGLDDAPGFLLDAAVAMAGRAIADGRPLDGSPGLVYTTDWQGVPIVRERMHWVVAEATATAAVLASRTGDERWPALWRSWWDEIRRSFRDGEHGSWHHELDPSGRPSATVWRGKPDVYHALQATLVPRLPVSGSFAGALAAGRAA